MKRSFFLTLALATIIGFTSFSDVRAQKGKEQPKNPPPKGMKLPPELLKQIRDLHKGNGPLQLRLSPQQLSQLIEKHKKGTLKQEELKKLVQQQQRPRGPRGRRPSTEEQRKQFERMQKQFANRKVSPNEKNHSAVKKPFESVVKRAAESTVRVLANGKQVALGTVVQADGHIITKASELKGQPIECQLRDDRKVKATIVGTDKENDLALLKIKVHGLKSIALNTNDTPPVGSILATPSMTKEPISIGVVSVAPRKIGISGGFLGVMLEQAEGGPRISQVVPNSSAAKAGLRVNDVIKKINGQVVKTTMAMIQMVRKMNPGQGIKVAVQRKDKEVMCEATLGKRPTRPQGNARGGRQNMMNEIGGPISERRTQFPNVLQHDSVLQPNQCGGPIVDLKGRVIGINIARAGRVETYAIPTGTVKSVVARLKTGKSANN